MNVRRIIHICLSIIFIILFICGSIVMDGVAKASIWLILSLMNVYLGWRIKEDEK